MANLDGFDASKEKDMMTFDAIPKGDYLAMATESEMKPTKDGNGKYLQFQWQVMEGEHKGSLLWSRLNLENKSTKAVEIAKRELGTICKACKVIQPKDSSELHGIPVVLSVVTEKYNDGFSNKIKGYKSPNGATAAATPATSEAASATSETSEASPPWMAS